MLRSRASYAALLAGALTMTACSSGPSTPTADDPAFDGIDQATVQEVLASKRELATLATEQTEEGKKSLAQGIAMRFVTCREYYRMYDSWMRTGQRPVMPPKRQPTHPYPDPDKENDMERSDVRTFLASNDMTGLGKWIANPSGGCGNDIPLKPGDETGPTLSDAIKKTLG